MVCLALVRFAQHCLALGQPALVTAFLLVQYVSKPFEYWIALSCSALLSISGSVGMNSMFSLVSFGTGLESLIGWLFLDKLALMFGSESLALVVESMRGVFDVETGWTTALVLWYLQLHGWASMLATWMGKPKFLGVKPHPAKGQGIHRWLWSIVLSTSRVS